MTNVPDKIVYTAVATSVGGRRGGRATTSDGQLDLRLTAPKELGGPGTGTNPEQLFAAGYAACFNSAVLRFAKEAGVDAQEAWVTANVGFGPEMRGRVKAERHQAARRHIELVGLAGFEHCYPHELSGGMQQRAAIAQALVQDPDILLMDEPFGALDEQTRMTMGDELLRIWEATRKTVVFITHSLQEAVYLGDQVTVLTASPGRIAETIAVPLERPRRPEMMTWPEFERTRVRLWTWLRQPDAARHGNGAGLAPAPAR